MNLGEKLLKLRKEKGLSQEALAEQIDQAGNQQMHRRRAERENNQGYPETEKLLQLSNIFGVSVDYLLKDDTCKEGTEEKGYYVSKEMAQGFLMKESRVSRSVAVGFMFWALAGIPFCMFPNHCLVWGCLFSLESVRLSSVCFMIRTPMPC